jgi:hypothetical protein
MSSMGSSFVDVTVKSRCAANWQDAPLQGNTIRASYHVTASQYHKYHKSPVQERQFCSRKIGIYSPKHRQYLQFELAAGKVTRLRAPLKLVGVLIKTVLPVEMLLLLGWLLCYVFCVGCQGRHNLLVC